MLIELLTGLNMLEVREMIDDSLFEELTELICQRHAEAPQEAEPSFTNPPALACRWPESELHMYSALAAKCVRKEAKLRHTLVSIIPKLEARWTS